MFHRTPRSLSLAILLASAPVAVLSVACGDPPAEKPAGPPPEAKKLADGRYEVPRAWLKDSKAWYGDNASRDFSMVNDPNGAGVRIAGFHGGSRADKMGLEEGDILRSVDGKEVESVEKAIRLLGALGDGETATLELLRKGQPLTVIFEIK